MGGGERLHHGGADLPARVGVRPGDEPEHAVHGGHSVTQRLHLHSGGACVGGGLGVVGHEREGLHEVKPSRFAQFPTAHFGQSADVFIPQPADAEHGVGRFAHPHKPRGAVGAGRKVYRRHFADAVAVVFVRRAQGHVAARDMGNRDMPRRCRSGHGEDLKPVPQQQHGVRAVGGKVVVKNFHRACDGFSDRLIGVVGEDRQSCRDGQAVGLDFMHGLAQTRAEVCPGHDELQVQHIGRRDFLHHRAQQAIFRPRGGNDGDGTHGYASRFLF